MIEISTFLKFEDKGNNEKKSFFELVYVTIVKLDDSVKEKKEIEKIILCDVQKDIQPKLEKSFTDLINNSGFKQVSIKNIDFEKLFNSKVDAVVCDGFVGNVALKTTEGVIKMFGNFLTAEYKKNWFTKIIALISLSLLKAFKRRLDPRRYNGASFLGLNGIVIKSHGGADILSLKTAIITAIEESENKVIEKIKKQIKIESNLLS